MRSLADLGSGGLCSSCAVLCWAVLVCAAACSVLSCQGESWARCCCPALFTTNYLPPTPPLPTHPTWWKSATLSVCQSNPLAGLSSSPLFGEPAEEISKCKGGCNGNGSGGGGVSSSVRCALRALPPPVASGTPICELGVVLWKSKELMSIEFSPEAVGACVVQ